MKWKEDWWIPGGQTSLSYYRRLHLTQQAAGSLTTWIYGSVQALRSHIQFMPPLPHTPSWEIKTIDKWRHCNISIRNSTTKTIQSWNSFPKASWSHWRHQCLLTLELLAQHAALPCRSLLAAVSWGHVLLDPQCSEGWPAKVPAAGLVRQINTSARLFDKPSCPSLWYW